MIAERYKVVRELGQGGMGVVYLVEDTDLNEKIALKMIRPDLIANPEAHQRLIDEVRNAHQLLHPNILRIHNLERWNDQPFITMEYIAGQSLRDMINVRKAEPPLFEITEVVSIVAPLLDALSYAHRKKIIHRDIKPENILVVGDLPDISIMVVDFGIAKSMSRSNLTQTAQRLGTDYYMSPEQRRGAAVDQRTDLYSVGMILYEIITGNLYLGRSKMPSELFDGIPASVDEVIEGLLQPVPEDRYSSASEARAVLLESEVKAREMEKRNRADAIKELLSAGLNALDENRWAEAAGLFEQILIIDSTHDEARKSKQKANSKILEFENLLRRIERAESAGNGSAALGLVEKALSFVPDDKNLLDKKAALERKRDLHRKGEALRGLIEAGTEAMHKRRWQEAVKLFDQILILDAGNEQAARLLNEARSRNEHLQKLFKDIATAEAKSDFKRGISLIDEAMPYVENKESLRTSRSILTDKIAEKERLSRADKLLEKASADMHARKWWDAETALKEALNLDPHNQKIGHLLTEAKQKADRFLEIIKEVEDAENLNQFERGLKLTAEGLELAQDPKHLESKRKIFEEAWRKVQSKVDYLMQKCERYSVEARWQDAEKNLNRVLKIDPRNDRARALLAKVRDKSQKIKALEDSISNAEKNGRFEEGIDLARQALSISRDQNKFLRKIAEFKSILAQKDHSDQLNKRLRKGKAELGNKKWVEAEKAAYEAMDIEPGNEDARNILDEARKKQTVFVKIMAFVVIMAAMVSMLIVSMNLFVN